MGERRDAVRTGNHSQSKMTTQISKKRKFVADGVFYAELNELLTRELAEDGYAGVDVRVTPLRTEIIIKATRTQQVLGEKGRRIRELASVVQKRFNFAEGTVELYAERVAKGCEVVVSGKPPEPPSGTTWTSLSGTSCSGRVFLDLG